MQCIVVHYSEIATKGKNRNFFEKKLIINISKSLGNMIKSVYKRYGRIVCDLDKKSEYEKIIQALEKIPGIAYFSFATKTDLDLEKIKKVSVDVLKNEKFDTFKVVSRRSNKNFPSTSQELNNILGEHILNRMKKRVDVKNPDLKLYVEVCEKGVFVFCNKHYGIGGLPVDVSGKMICSLSGGIDSPVSSFMMMKRGCRVIFVHIYNETVVGSSVLTKLDDILSQLTKFQTNSRLCIIPFGKIQREITASVPSEFRMIVYRRIMMRIINRIAVTENAKGIVTGDNIGQVASQTLENLQCIYGASKLPVFTPLIGMNKEEIIKIAEKIGTYKYSILPYPDCCSYMIAKHPETRADIGTITRIENNIKNQEKLIEESIKEAKIKVFESRN